MPAVTSMSVTANEIDFTPFLSPPCVNVQVPLASVVAVAALFPAQLAETVAPETTPCVSSCTVTVAEAAQRLPVELLKPESAPTCTITPVPPVVALAAFE